MLFCLLVLVLVLRNLEGMTLRWVFIYLHGASLFRTEKNETLI